jgi:cellulose biosynthesis protein BcsQ
VIDRLVEAVREISPLYGFVIIDTPPILGLLFIGAHKAASHVIVPVAAQYLPLEGVGDLLVSLEELIARGRLVILGALVTRFNNTNLSTEALSKIESDPTLGPKLFPSVITENTKLAEALAKMRRLGSRLRTIDPHDIAQRLARDLDRLWRLAIMVIQHEINHIFRLWPVRRLRFELFNPLLQPHNHHLSSGQFRF